MNKSENNKWLSTATSLYQDTIQLPVDCKKLDLKITCYLPQRRANFLAKYGN